jgi:hypothetical protein
MELLTPVHKEATVKHAKRFGGWWLGCLVLIGVIGLYANQQLPVLMFKAAQVCLGLMLAYVADRTLFSNAPNISCEMPTDMVGAARIVARAIVALAVIVGLTVGI